MTRARAALFVFGRSFGRKAASTLVQAACYAVVLSCGTTNAADRNNDITGVSNAPVLTTIIASLNPSTIAVGQSVTAGAALLNQSGFPIDSGTAVSWSTTDPAVAGVSSTGVVTGISVGSTQLMASVLGVHGQITVNVIVPPPVLTTMTVTIASPTLPASVTTTATAAGLDQNGAAIATGTVIWTTSNPAVASVSKIGAITGLSVGTADITAISGAVQAHATVTVTAIPVAFVSVTAPSGTVAIGLTSQLTVKATDANNTVLTGRTIVWSTSDATKATVSATGLVTGIGTGAVTITATSEGKKGTAVLAINSGVNGVSINPTTATILVGGIATATASISVVTGIGNTLKFTSSDTTIATVTSVGNVVTIVGVGAGVATIKASSVADATKFASVAVTVDLYALAFTVQPANTVGGVSIAPAVTVTVKDALGATVVASVDNITLNLGSNPGNGTLGGTTTVAAVAGVATFGAVNVNKIGSGYTLTASAAGMVTATSNTFNVTVGPPAKIAVLVQPATTFVLTNITPAVQFQIQDAGGNLVAAAVNPVTVALLANPGGSTLTGGLVHAAAAGVASFGDLQLNFGGTGYTIQATSPGLTSVVTSAFNVTGPFTMLSSAGATTCGVMAATTYCWGDNSSGILGVNIGIGNSNTPRLVVGLHVFSSLGSGSGYYCGATTATTAFCWGNGTGGSLGNGIGGSSSSPVQVSGGHTWNSVSGSCGIDAAGALFCWGDNSSGQLGNNSNTASNIPTAVFGGFIWASVSVGGDGHTCGITTLQKLYCWGNNSVGQIGDNTTTQRKTPTLIAGTWLSVSAGSGSQTCGIQAGNNAYCWGSNTQGLLGAGVAVPASWPVPLFVGSFSKVSAGGTSNCAIGVAGAVSCWGANDSGQLGNNSTTFSNVPVSVSGGLAFASLSVTSSSACGITTVVGSVYCWGNNASGQLGNGNFLMNKVPVRISTPP